MNILITLFTFLLASLVEAHVVDHPSSHQSKTTHEHTTIMSKGTRVLSSPSGLSFKILLEQANFTQANIELAEITLPVGLDSGSHRHHATEIFYVLEGELGHQVGDRKVVLRAGNVGIAPKGVPVVHTTLSDIPVKTLVIWTPAGEIERLSYLGMSEQKISKF